MIQRYESWCGQEEGEMRRDADGDWVRYPDYRAHVEALTRLIEKMLAALEQDDIRARAGLHERAEQLLHELQPH